MADQKSTDAALTALCKTYYNKMLIERLEPKTYLYQFGIKKPLPGNNGKIIEFTGYRNMKPLMSDGSELSSTQAYISAYKINATLVERDNYVQVSTILKKIAIDPNVSGAVEVISDQMAKSVEMLIRQKVIGLVGNAKRSSTALLGYNYSQTNVNSQGVMTTISSDVFHKFYSQFPILGNKTRLTSSGCTFRAAGSAMSVNQIRHAVSWLRNLDVEPYDDGNYILYCHTMVADAIMQDPKWRTWNSPQNATKMFRGEVGNIFGAKIIVGNMAPRYEFSAAPMTTASGAMNLSFMFGKGAFGVSELGNAGANNRGFEIIVKSSGDQSTNDPANKLNTIAGKFIMTAVVLNKSAGVLIRTTDRVVTSGT